MTTLPMKKFMNNKNIKKNENSTVLSNEDKYL